MVSQLCTFRRLWCPTCPVVKTKSISELVVITSSVAGLFSYLEVGYLRMNEDSELIVVAASGSRQQCFYPSGISGTATRSWHSVG